MSEYSRPLEQIILREADEKTAETLSEELSITMTLARILVGRGLIDFKESKKFFNPELSQFHSPFKFASMQKAVERIEEAIASNEKICIHGDYDVDGVTSTTLLMRILKKLGANCTYYLPDRLTEGYGLSKGGIDAIKKMAASLIITVDCAITAIEPIDYANSLNIDTIITDHHEPKETLPAAFAILDPKVESENYPDLNLAGVGVALKLMQGLCEHMKAPTSFWENELDIVSLGTAADIVPFVGENRVIAHFGYKLMRNTKNLGLRTLMELQDITGKELNTGDVVFKLAPCINAAGRLGDPSRGVKLFTSEDEGECRLYANELVRINSERRALDARVQQEALLWSTENINFDEEFAVVAGSEDWHAGVIGIAASKMVENFCRPAFLFSIDKDGIAHGSGRSISGCNLLSALDECKDLLDSYGGHTVACGASMKKENLPEFRTRFTKAIAKQVTKEQLVPTVKVDAEIAVPQLTPKFFNILKRMEPFGPRNMRPVLVTRNVKNFKSPRTVGKGGAHLKLEVISDGQIIEGIGFGFGKRARELASATSFTLAYTLTENSFRGQTSLQMTIKGIEI
jgi:single-stranded-DNA-specific exonuclease